MGHDRESQRRSANQGGRILGVLGLSFCFTLGLSGRACAEGGSSQPPAAQEQDWPASFRQDANLFDVCFVNAHLGWAVGDRGTILHTVDGGQTWELQESQVSCRLEAIQFLDPKHGFAVGGWTVPYTHRSLGVILRTEDGGQTWVRQAGPFLPWLRGVQFHDLQHGIVYGNPSAMYPSAVFTTHDGGAHWTARPGQSLGWVDGAFDAIEQGLLLERNGRISTLTAKDVQPTDPREPKGRLALRVATHPTGPWVLCGNQGLVQQSEDEGRSWSTPRNLPPADALAEFDWQAVTTRDSATWIVGAPGSRVLHTADGGQHWQWLPTGSDLPLHAIEFADGQHGWAVGALGTILVTHDGGASWQFQRGEGRRLAVIGVFGQAEQIPWEAVAHLAASEGYALSLELLAASASAKTKSGQTPFSTRLHEAATRLGAVGANVIQSLPAADLRLDLPADEIRQRWDEVTQADSIAQVTEYLARQFRTWRPDLVLLADPAAPGGGISDLARQIVLQAIEGAASAQEYPSQLQAGLAPWRVGRVTHLTTDSSPQHYAITATRLILPLGQTVGQLADQARGNLEPVPQPGPEQLAVRSLSGTAGSPQRLFATSSAAAAATRRSDSGIAADVRQRSQDAQRRRNLEVMLRSRLTNPTATWQQTLHMAEELSSQHRTELFWNCAAEARRRGQTELAFELLGQLARPAAPHPLAEPARVQLLWYLASAEAAIHWPIAAREESQLFSRIGAVGPNASPIQQVSFDATFPANLTATRSAPPAEPTVSGPTAQQATRDADREQARQQQLKQLVAAIQTEQPDLYFEPQVRFPLAAYQRRTGQAEEAVRFWRSQLSGRTNAAYRSLAATEVALSENSATATRPMWKVLRVSQPPRLDGDLADGCWSALPVVQLLPATWGTPRGALNSNDAAATAWPTTECRIGYDNEFLYLSLRCDKVPALSYPAATGLRQRDAARSEDRCEILIDIDRDSVTQWRLAIDYRGWANDQLNDDPTWNPTWYLAPRGSDDAWQIEAAIPLGELSRDAVRPGTVWSIGVQRLVPGVMCATWMQPAPVEASPEEFGLLVFE